MKSLQEIWEELKRMGYGSDKADIHSYLPVYEWLFEPYRNEPIEFLEIGLFKGDSLRLWDAYFKSGARGIDCDEQPHGGMADLRPMIAEGWLIDIGDAGDAKFIEQNYFNLKFNIVIEDGSHAVSDQLRIYQTMKPYLAKGSIYCIEDIQDIDRDREIFENIDPEKEVTILDRRCVKGRYDDCLVIITDKK